MRTIDLVNTSEKHTPPDGELDAIVAAIGSALHVLAAHWGEYVWHILFSANMRGFQVVLIDNPDVAGALGYHDLGPDGKPYAKIFLDPIFDNGGTWHDGTISVSAVVSHEVFEMIGDPMANLWANDAQGVNWARELCDAVEADFFLVNGIALSNYVLPSYFNPFGEAPFDLLGSLGGPFEVDQGGYAIREEAGQITQVFGDAYVDWRGRRSGQYDGTRTAERKAYAAR